jgi:hypothetical protein
MPSDAPALHDAAFEMLAGLTVTNAALADHKRGRCLTRFRRRRYLALMVLAICCGSLLATCASGLRQQCVLVPNGAEPLRKREGSQHGVQKAAIVDEGKPPEDQQAITSHTKEGSTVALAEQRAAPADEPRAAWLPAPAVRWQPCGVVALSNDTAGVKNGTVKPLPGWAVVTAYVDTRPLANGGRPALVFIMAGPPSWGAPSNGAANFTAVLEPLAEPLPVPVDQAQAHGRNAGATSSHMSQAAGHAASLRTNRFAAPSAAGASVLRLRCNAPAETPLRDLHATTFGRRLLRCPVHPADWEAVVLLARVAACVVDSADAEGPVARFAGGCPPGSAVPVGTLHNFPGYPLPAGQRILDHDSRQMAIPSPLALHGLTPRRAASVEYQHSDIMAHVAGIGRTAVCVAPVRGDLYASSLAFFLEYYGAVLGVDTVFMYMQSPGPAMLKAAADAVAAGGAHGRPVVTLVPWCVTSSATYAPCQAIQGDGGGGAALHDDDFHNYGQTLQAQDCAYRAMGIFRWVLAVDLDEYVLLPQLPNATLATSQPAAGRLPTPLAALVEAQRVLAGTRVVEAVQPAPVEIGFRGSTFFEGCSGGPTRLSDNVTEERVGLHPSLRARWSIDSLAAAGAPYPVWTPVSLRHVQPYGRRSKFAYDPLLADEISIHTLLHTQCNQHDGAPPWPVPCQAPDSSPPSGAGNGPGGQRGSGSLQVLGPEVAIVANVWAPLPNVTASEARAEPNCPTSRRRFGRENSAALVLDWSLANWWLARHPDGQAT